MNNIYYIVYCQPITIAFAYKKICYQFDYKIRRKSTNQ